MPTGLFALSSIEPHICCLKIVFKIIVSTFLSHPALFVVMSECFSCKMQIDSDVKFCPGCGADQANKRLKQSLTGEGQAIVAAINGSLGAKIDVVDNKLTVFAASPRTYQALRGCPQLTMKISDFSDNEELTRPCVAAHSPQLTMAAHSSQ